MKTITSIRILLLLLLSCIAINLKAQVQLSPDEFERKLKAAPQAQLIDVRTSEEYKDGYLPASENIDYKSGDFDTKIKALDKKKPVFVYCLSGGRSSAAAKKLVNDGFTEVYDMKGGYLKWSSSGKKVEGAASANRAGMTMAEFEKVISSSKVVFIDFYAKWCAPCIKMLPVITKLKSEYKGRADIQTINYDPNKALAKELGIDEIPAFLLYKDGKLVVRKNGALEEKDFRALLDSNL